MAQDNRTTLFHSVVWPNILDLPKNKKKYIWNYKYLQKLGLAHKINIKYAIVSESFNLFLLTDFDSKTKLGYFKTY